ncbi:MAG: response regulator [Nitrospiraceae bacterium]
MFGEGKRILLVEDDEDIRFLLADVFLQEGYDVHQAGDGREGLAEMKRRRHDVVLCDYHMPHMDGLTFLDVSRLLWPDTPVIMASCDSELMERKDSQPLLSAYACLSKPFDLDQLMTAVREAASHTYELRYTASR